MNCNIYLWGNLESGYSQYPTNYTQNIIKSVFSKFDNTIRDLCAIIRNEDLIYLIYGYQYKKDKRFGVCLEFNRVCPCNINYIYSFFRAIINDILAKGKLLHYTTSGEIQSDVNQLYEQSAAIEDYVDFIIHNFNEEQANFQRIPPINRGADYNSIAYALDESTTTIINALRQHGTLIFLPKKEDESINSYANVLKQLNKKNIKLQEDNRILRGQKNKYKWVIILISVIFIGSIVFFIHNNEQNIIIYNLTEELSDTRDTLTFTNKKLTNTTNALTSTKNELSVANTTITKLTATNKLVTDSLRNTETELEYKEALINEKNKNIADLKAQLPQQYKTKYKEQYLYNKCDGKYTKANCYYPSNGTIVTIYLKENGYGLTHIGGWIPMNCLEKY